MKRLRWWVGPMMALGLAAGAPANPDGSGWLDCNGGADLQGTSESLTWFKAPNSFVDSYQANYDDYFDLGAAMPLAESLTLKVGGGYSRFGSTWTETANGGAGRWERDLAQQSHDFSLGANLYPAAWFRPHWRLEDGNPDGWLGWPTLYLGVDHSYSVSAYTFPVLVGYFPQSAFSVDDNSWVGSYEVVEPVTSFLSLWAEYDHDYQDIWQQSPYGGDTRDSWEALSAGAYIFQRLWRGAGGAFPRVGLPGQARWDLEYHQQYFNTDQRMSVVDVIARATVAVNEDWALDLDYIHLQHQYGYLDSVNFPNRQISSNQMTEQRLFLAVLYSFGDADPGATAPGPPPGLDEAAPAVPSL